MSPARQPQRGSLTLVALCLAIVIAISLASYLALCRQSLQLSTRTMHLDRARQLAETGLEEALWALNYGGSNGTWNQSGPNSGINWSGTSTTQRSCNLPGPSKPNGYDLGQGARGQLTLTVDFAAPYSAHTPKITSVATVTVPGQGTFTKRLTATTKPAPLFANAIGVVNGSLTLPSGTVIDSWDSDYDAAAVAPVPSHDYNASGPASVVPYGMVAPVAPHLINPLNTNAVVSAPNLTLNGTATIFGYAATFGNILNFSVSAQVRGPLTPAVSKIDQSRVSKSAFVPSFTITTPTPTTGFWNYLPANAAWGASRTVGNGTTTPEYWASNTNESGMSTYNGGGNDLLLDGAKTLIIDGYVILAIEEDFELKGSAQIIINPGSRLEIYARDDVQISDSAGFFNNTDEPKNFALFCTSQYSGDFAFTYNSSAAFNGVIDTLDNNEGAVFNSSITYSGALLASSTPTINGVLTLHYDTALQYLPKGWFKGVNTPFMLEQITETP